MCIFSEKLREDIVKSLLAKRAKNAKKKYLFVVFLVSSHKKKFYKEISNSNLAKIWRKIPMQT